MINFRRYINPVRARKRRYQKICPLVNLKASDKILDLGCGEGLSFEAFNRENKIVGLDISPKQRVFQRNFSYLQGKAEDLGRLKDKEFDLVVCIGVLEHISSQEKLKKAADEIQRVGKKYLVVVPHLYTLLEPHYQLPFWQFYPDNFKSFLIRHFSIGHYKKNSEGEFEKLNYLKKKKWQSLFPGSIIISYNHLLGGLIRNYIIFKP